MLLLLFKHLSFDFYHSSWIFKWFDHINIESIHISITLLLYQQIPPHIYSQLKWNFDNGGRHFCDNYLNKTKRWCLFYRCFYTKLHMLQFNVKINLCNHSLLVIVFVESLLIFLSIQSIIILLFFLFIFLSSRSTNKHKQTFLIISEPRIFCPFNWNILKEFFLPFCGRFYQMCFLW